MTVASMSLDCSGAMNCLLSSVWTNSADDTYSPNFRPPESRQERPSPGPVTDPIIVAVGGLIAQKAASAQPAPIRTWTGGFRRSRTAAAVDDCPTANGPDLSRPVMRAGLSSPKKSGPADGVPATIASYVKQQGRPGSAGYHATEKRQNEFPETCHLLSSESSMVDRAGLVAPNSGLAVTIRSDKGETTSRLVVRQFDIDVIRNLLCTDPLAGALPKRSRI